MKVHKFAHIFLLFLFCAVAHVTARAENVATLSKVTVVPGDEIEIDFRLSNTESILGVQFELSLPEQLEYVQGSAVLNETRSNGHSISASRTGSKLKVLVYNLQPSELLEDDGTVFVFRLRAGAVPGEYNLCPEVTLVGQGSSQPACSIKNGSVCILASRLTLQDDMVDFGHVAVGGEYTKTLAVKNTGTKTLTVNDIRGKLSNLSIQPSSFTLAASTSRTLQLSYTPTTRGAIKESITLISDADNGEQAFTVAADPYMVNELHVGNAEGVSDTEVTVSVSMNNMDPIAGVQCSFQLTDELSFVSGSAKMTERSNGHTVSALVKDNLLTFIVYSSSQSLLKGSDGELFTFRLLLNGTSGTYVLQPENVVLGMVDMGNVVSDATSGNVTIQSPSIQIPELLQMKSASLVDGANGTFLITNTSKLPLTISNMTFADEGYTVTEELPLLISAGSSESIHVTYKGVEAGNFHTTLNVYSNDPEHRVSQIAISGSLYEPNELYLEQLTGREKECTFSVSAENYSEITGLQLDVQLQNSTSTKFSLSMSERLNGFKSSIKQTDNNTWRILIYSLEQGAKIMNHSGELFRLTLEEVKIQETPGSLSLKSIVLSGTDKTNHYTGSVELTSEIIIKDTPRYIINLEASPYDGNPDKTRVVFNDEASMSYESSCDAAKFWSDNLNIQICTLDPDGICYYMNERPLLNGCVPLGIKIKTGGQFSITATRMDKEVWIYDAQTFVLHNLSDCPYTFDSTKGTFNSRLQLITPQTENLGDINNNSNISISDITSLIKIMQGSCSININPSSADMDRNGKISKEDLKLLEKLLLEE